MKSDHKKQITTLHHMNNRSFSLSVYISYIMNPSRKRVVVKYRKKPSNYSRSFFDHTINPYTHGFLICM